MNPIGSFLIFFSAFLAAVPSAMGQTLRTRTEAPPAPLAEVESPWSGNVRYAVDTDYADTSKPRGYTNSLFTSLNYNFNHNWSVGFEGGARAEFFDGQVDKGSQESYAEVVSPTTSFELDYETKFWGPHVFTIFTHGEPLWDEASRLEGYKGLVGAGTSLTLNYFHKVFSIAQSLDATELLNTYTFATDTSSNPDYFVTYKLATSVRFWGSYKFTYVFGLKTTRYMDGFWGYNYEDTLALSKSWGKLVVAVAYDNGGFTDDGTLNLWFIDQYRRIGRVSMNYSF